jgi:HSP20 family protein
MADLVRWDPFRDLLSFRRSMDRLFDETFAAPVASGDRYYGAPAVDMYQTDDEVVVKATLPGVKPEDISISVTGEVLTIRGEVKEEKKVDEAEYHLHERRYGSFSRSLPLPTSVRADKAEAHFEHGVLTLALPKAEEVKPKTITVKAK